MVDAEVPDGAKDAKDSSLKAYYVLLRKNANMRNLWLGELVDNAGGWFNYVATLALVDRLSQGSSVAISMVLIVRFLPFAFFFPIAGVVADRYRREVVLIVTCLLDAGIVALLALAQWLPYIWPLYALLFLQFSCAAFYDPARRSLTPLIVPPAQLHLAATIDSTTWSLMAAVGSAMGGFVSSRLGPTACFLLDSLSYLVAAWFAWRLLGKVPATPPQVGGSSPAKGISTQQGTALDNLNSVELIHQRGSESPMAGSPRKRALQQAQELRLSADTGFRERGAVGGSQEPPRLPDIGDASAAAASGGFGATALHRFRDELGDVRAGFSYISHSSNRGVAMLTLLKATGAMVWAAADIMNVKYAVLPDMQALGDEQLTLGWIFGAVGVGCLVGPIWANWLTEPEPPQLMRTICLSFGFLWLSFAGMAVSGHIWGVLLCTVLRSAGAAIIWVYSTLLLQLVVPNALLGRMMALELAFNTVCESTGGLWAGVAMDQAGLSVRQLALIMACLGLLVCACWSAYTLLGVHSSQHHKAPGSKYQAVASDDAEAPAAVLQGAEE